MERRRTHGKRKRETERDSQHKKRTKGARQRGRKKAERRGESRGYGDKGHERGVKGNWREEGMGDIGRYVDVCIYVIYLLYLVLN